MQRPCRTPNQFYARALAFDLLNTQYKNRDNTEIVSIAHTKGAVVAAGSNRKSHLAIGVDIEHHSRQLPDILGKYYLTSEDLHTGLNTLQLWCLKEAAFKCLDNFSKTLSLKHICIKRRNSSGFLLQAAGKNCTGALWLSKTGYHIATVVA
ncbi:MAG: 4'-phosphopantetheinyl transferase superfamily protein [Pseudomonadota bacterium]